MLRTLAILLLLASPAFAGWREPSVVCVESGGAGCFVRTPNGPRILSCAHESARSNVKVGQVIRVQLWNDASYTAVVQSVDDTADCSLLNFNFPLPAEITPRTIAATVPPVGAQVWVCGFPMTTNGRYSVRVTTARGDDMASWTIHGAGIPGESGGPVVDASGDVVGVLFAHPNNPDGSAMPISLCSPLPAIQKLCCQGGSCQNGRCPIVYQQLPSPPPMVNPPMAPRPPANIPQPTIDWQAKYEKLESNFAALQLDFAALKKQVSAYSECNCGDCVAKCDAKIAVAIAGIKLPQPEKPQPVNTAAVTAEVIRQLPPINMRVSESAPYQPMKLGSYVTLPLDKK